MANKVCDLSHNTCNPKFFDLKAGDIFRFAGGSTDNIYMKMEDHAAVLLRNGGYYQNPIISSEVIIYSGVSIIREK